ncbi:DUF896 family protein [Marinococcus halophilus]|uniref:UPF0291 protein MHA01_14690 n=1 Tax=Marinococcus halophilus TaxID=1371 RepID=A0A510Y5G6_MARHA|nr:DUF896 domain-containing protein [Marinococcus halophilus]OZT80490.1 DUF896 family protein [Marinococcus halophilus]GEK58564.1 UPF0291 protein [Marinococcus halophilus]
MIATLPRINELARKKVNQGLTAREQQEQKLLREEYLQMIRGSMEATLLTTTVQDPEGNDVTPEKLKNVQS